MRLQSLSPFWYLALSIVLLAVVLRLPLLGGSFWLDEAAQALEVVRPWSQQLKIADDFQPPLLHLILHAAQYFSTSEAYLRTWGALIPGIVSILGSLWLCRQWGGTQKSVLLLGLLLASSSWHVFYSQELRPYALPMLWAVLSWVSVVKYETTSHRNWLIGAVLSHIAGFYSSYLYPFFWFGQLIYLLYQYVQSLAFSPRQILFLLTKPTSIASQQTKSVAWLLIATVLSPIAFLPWLPFFLEQLGRGQAVRTALPGWETVVSIPQMKSLSLVVGKFYYGVVDIQFTTTYLVPILLLGGAVLLACLKLWQKWGDLEQNRKKAIIALICWLVIPIAVAWLISFVVPVLRPKRVLFTLPAFYMSLVLLLEYSKTRVLAISLGLMLIVNSWSLHAYYTHQELQRENWRELHQTITTRFDTTETILVFAHPAPFSPWVWYDQYAFPTISLGKLSVAAIDPIATLAPISQYQKVLVFDYLRDLADPDDVLLTTVEEYYGFEPAGYLDQTGIGFVRVYTQPGSSLGLDI